MSECFKLDVLGTEENMLFVKRRVSSFVLSSVFMYLTLVHKLVFTNIKWAVCVVWFWVPKTNTINNTLKQTNN